MCPLGRVLDRAGARPPAIVNVTTPYFPLLNPPFSPPFSSSLVCNGLVSLLVGLEYSLLSSDDSPPGPPWPSGPKMDELQPYSFAAGSRPSHSGWCSNLLCIVFSLDPPPLRPEGLGL